MIVLKAWNWQPAGVIKSAHLWILCVSACMVLGGLIGILTLGFVMPSFEMEFMKWDMKRRDK